MATRRKSVKSRPTDHFAIAPRGLPNDAMADAYSRWLEQASRVGDEAFRFARDRLIKDFQAATQLADCSDSGEMLSLQAEFASNLAADYVAESRRMLNLIAGSATESVRNSGHRAGTRHRRH